MSLTDELDALKTEMERSLEAELFFFPSYAGVAGFYGTDRVWFVGQKPSTQEFPDRAVEFFYELLSEYGFENAHVTDITKEIGTVTDGIPAEEIERNRPYFRKELELLEPELLVAIGDDVKQALKWMKETDGSDIAHVRHYSWAVRWGHEDKLEEDIQAIAELNDELGL